MKIGTADEEAKLFALRDQVLRIVNMLSSSKGFDPTALEPFTEALRSSPAARSFVEAVVSGVVQRVTARVLREFLTPTTGEGSSAAAGAR